MDKIDSDRFTLKILLWEEYIKIYAVRKIAGNINRWELEMLNRIEWKDLIVNTISWQME